MAVRTALELARAAAAELRAAGIDSARLEAELLLAAVLGVDRKDLYLRLDRSIDAAQVAAFRERIERRLAREPIQYILGEASFRNLVLRVDRRVLIPRPETELLVGAVLDWAARRERWGTALDVGTGCGAIALALASEGRFVKVVATDVSADAIAVAAENVERLGLSARVELRLGAMWQPLQPGERFTVIVSNPPYVSEAARASLPPEVRDWEPAAALFAPGGGLSVLFELVEGAGARLERGGLLAIEVGWDQATAVRDRLASRTEFGPARIRHDLAGKERIVLAQRAG